MRVRRAPCAPETHPGARPQPAPVAPPPRVAPLGVSVVIVTCARGETIRLVDGDPVKGSVVSLDGGNLMVRDGEKTHRVPVASITAVEFEGERPAWLMATVGRCVAVALDGSRIGCIDASLAEGKLRGRNAFTEDIELSVKALSWLLLPAPHERPADVQTMTKALGLKPGDQDILVVKTPGGDPVTLPGIVLRMDAEQIVLDYDGVEQPMALKTVRAIQMAKPTEGAAVGKPAATVTLRDGSSIMAEAITSDGDTLTLTSVALGKVKVARKALGAIRFGGEQLVALADLKPKVEQTPFFDEDFPWQRDRAIGGGPLQLRGRVYEQGIGMHARCRMEFALGGKYSAFSAMAGIDDSVRTGSARFTISVDGKPPVVSSTLDRAEKPQRLNVDVKRAKKLTITADFVEGTMGSGARVDLCDAVLRK